ncbi:hypothetical protein [Halomonas sp.]|uniref:hypothetical protein n=1 Tax=Halomonas sp. TaxID=1486246 RepID=UPI00298E8D9D|nr:hypothetical protein [Halomonas sp.]MDW7748263.1 hypothetical protein [Halomonas sp.]
MTNEAQIKSVARDVKDFDFEAGHGGGVGEYTADIKVGEKEFSANLCYEYFYNDIRGFGSLPAWVVGESDGAQLGNFSKIEMAAEKAGIDIDENAIYEIIDDLESQVESYVEENYNTSIEAIQEAFETRQAELRQERDEEFSMGM